MKNISIQLQAKKYIKAILEVAKQNNHTEQFISDMEKLANFSKSFKQKTPNAKGMFSKLSILPKSGKLRIIEMFTNDLNLSPYTKNILTIIIQHNNFDVLKEILHNWPNIYLTHQGYEEIKVVSAVMLNEEQENKIKDNIKKMIPDNNFYITKIVDKKILGGLIFHIKNKVYDDSLLNKLNKIQNNVKGIN